MKKDISLLKEEYIGKSFGFLTISEIYRDLKLGIACKCICQCGALYHAALRKVLSGHVKSCGCYSKSKEFKDKLSNSFTSETRALISSKVKDWYKEHPDKVKEKAEKFSQWCKDHQDKVEESSRKVSEWCKNNPDKVKERSDKHKQWCIDHPEKLKELGEKHSQWCKDHPDKMRDLADRYTTWRKANSDKCTEIGNKVSQWYKDNPEMVKEKVNRSIKTFNKNKELNRALMKEAHRNKRIAAVKDLDLSFVHQDDLDKILNGDNSTELIRTKCPVCNKYDLHKIYYFIDYRDKTIRDIPRCKECAKENNTSSYENIIADFISTIYSGMCIKNSRDVISPFELDLYYPEKKVAIEYNGAFWHSEQNGCSKSYHFNKFKLCKEHGIRLISIFEQDWMLKNEKVLTLLADIFSDHKVVYARSCTIKALDYLTKSNFLDNNHFDGDSTQGNIAYGLYHNDELLSCMTFGKLRCQNHLRVNNNCYELVRFATASKVTIIGGASKLFAKFIKEYNPMYILCYSDNDFFSGDTYKILGFSLKSLGNKPIDYQWYNKKECKSQQQCMVKRLLQLYPEYDNLTIDGFKEKFVMESLGYYRVFRCGNSIWEWHRDVSTSESKEKSITEFLDTENLYDSLQTAKSMLI